jgi:hypothetical protein
MGNAIRQIALRHFGAKAVKALAKKGVVLVSLTSIPGPSGTYLDSDTGYTVSDNGTGRVLSFQDVRRLAGDV